MIMRPSRQDSQDGSLVLLSPVIAAVLFFAFLWGIA